MKTFKSLAAFLILTASTLILTGWYPNENETDKSEEENIIVLLKFKAQPDKGGQTISELTDLIEQVKEEPNFVSIKLHVDPNDETNILLYEEWQDQSYYKNEHMNTAHLTQFMANSTNFLTGPPEVTFWKVEDVFK